MARTIVKHVHIQGYVQGVGFRYYTQQYAKELCLTGWVRNCSDGCVETMICGTTESIEAMLNWLAHGPTLARVDKLIVRDTLETSIPHNFMIRR